MIKRFFLKIISPSLTKDFILLYRISLFGILIAGFFFIKFSIDQEQKKITTELLAASEKISGLIVYNIDYLKYQLHYASEQIRQNDNYQSKVKIEKILSSFVNDINSQVDLAIAWNAFSWVDKENKLTVDGAGGIRKKPTDMANRDYLKVTSKTPNTLVFGQPIIGALSRRMIVPIGIGVFSDQNQYLGTLVFGLDIEKILDKLEKNIGDETFNFVVFRDRQVAFASNNFDYQNLKRLHSFVQNPEPKHESHLVSSQNFLSTKNAFIYLKNTRDFPFKVFVLYDKQKSHERILNLFLKQLFFISLIVSTCVALFQSLYKRIVKPLSDLSKFALRISEKDFSYIMEKPEGGELLQLYDTLTLIKEAFLREEATLQELTISNSNLSKSNLARTNLLRSITHDIKNYIFGICGLAKIILDSKNTEEISKDKNLQLTENIFTQSEELMHFVVDLLDTNQIESGELSLGRMTKCNVKELIERITLLSHSLAIKNHILFKIEVEENIPQLECDVRRVKQILNNLITNAVKYSYPNTTVKINAKHLKERNQICFEIVDSGIGMNQEEVDMIFSGVGKNIDKSELKKEVDSYGIGMPIVLRLIKLHNAKIEIDSQKAVGTTIRLYFQISRDDKKADYKNIFDTNTIKKFKKTILLVEDNPVNLKVTSTILRNAGYLTQHVENGKEALKILDEKNFDLILMDGEMPVMNGYEAAKIIRDGKIFKKFKNFKTIPIIALMSTFDEETMKLSKESGMNDHLEKSISKSRLLETVEEYLS
jgi:signal transduction histidine kinase/CheY-like chemotaxis protein